MTDKKASPFKQIVSNLPFHNFNDVSRFTGIYVRTVTLGETDKFEANIMIDLETGEAVHVTNSYSIDKAIRQAREDYPEEIQSENVVFDIEYLGKTEIKGKPFNQFNIGVCTLQQYEAFNSGSEKLSKPAKK